MKNMLTILVLLLAAIDVRAEQVSLIEAPQKTAEALPVVQPPAEPVKIPKEDADKDFQSMKEFMQQENERLKDIKILDLDLQRADLELKKREIEIKLAALNKDQNPVFFGPELSTGPAFKVVGIFLNGKTRQALMKVGGANRQVHEGEKLNSDASVKTITADAVILQFSNGETGTFTLGS